MPITIKKCELHTKKTDFVEFIIKSELKREINKRDYFKLKKNYLNQL